MTLIRFTEDRYLPFVKEHKRISTYHGYRNMWKRYLSVARRGHAARVQNGRR